MPKRVGFLYEKMLNKAFIQNAILCAAAKKRKRKDVQKVLREMTVTPGWEPPALLNDYYEEVVE